MERKLEIVLMKKEDIPHIHEIEQMCFSTPWSENILLQEFEFPLSILYVAHQNGRVVGFAGMHHVVDEGLINNIAVHPDCRRLGIAEELLNTLIKYGFSNNFYRLTLEVRVSNLAAQRLYEKLGFINEGTRPNYYDLPNEDAFIYSYFYKPNQEKDS